MKSLAILLFAALTTTAFAQTDSELTPVHRLTLDGVALVAQGQYQQALEKFNEAEKADPLSSEPYSGRASAFFSASKITKSDNVEKYRQQAANLAQVALKRNPSDVIALEVLRQLSELDVDHYHPKENVIALVAEGEIFFGKREYKEALAKYEEAMKADPKYVEPIIFAGDCYFAQGKMPEATKYFQRATQVDPLAKQAWRFLADALVRQGQVNEAREALYGAIAALPTYLPAWENLNSLTQPNGLKRIIVKPKAAYEIDSKTKAPTIKISDSELSKNEASSDLALWLAYAVAHAPDNDQHEQKSVFQVELSAWEKTFVVLGEFEGKDANLLVDPVIKQLQSFQKVGDLKPAIFLLTFKEAYRADFETWKKDHPTGIRDFIAKYSVRP